MSSAYGNLNATKGKINIQIADTLKDGTSVHVVPMEADHIPTMHSILNDLIDKGKTYPQVISP
jgi:hypothetical protein